MCQVFSGQIDCSSGLVGSGFKLWVACSRLLVNGAYRMRPGNVRRVGSGRERGKVGRACKHCFKNLIPVYQLPVYPLIGLF